MGVRNQVIEASLKDKIAVFEGHLHRCDTEGITARPRNWIRTKLVQI